MDPITRSDPIAPTFADYALEMRFLTTQAPRQPEADLRKTYDAVVVGSGAAGGMAAYVLTAQGLNVLLLEAGKQIDTTAVLKSMEWPYDHPRRGDMPAKFHALTAKEYNGTQSAIRHEGLATGEGLLIRSGLDRLRLQHLARRQRKGSSVHRHELRVGARALPGREDQYLGPAGPSALGLRLQGQDARRLRRGLADLVCRHRAVLRQGGSAPRYFRCERKPEGAARRQVPAPVQAERGGSHAAQCASEDGTDGDAVPRRRDDRRFDSQQISQQVLRPRRVQPACRRLRHPCRLRFADRPDFPARDTGRLTIRTNATAHEVQVDPATGKAGGVGFIDTVTGKSHAAKAKAVVLAASTLESTRLLLLSKSSQHPNGIANSSGVVGHYFCEHLMGPNITGLAKDRVGAPRTLDDGRPGGFYVPRFRNLEDKRSDYIRGFGFEGGSGAGMVPGDAASEPGFGKAWKKHVRDYAGAYIDMGGFGEVLPRYENSVSIDPVVKDRWGIPVLRFDYRFGDNEKKMAADMAATAQEMFEAAGFEIVDVGRSLLTEGWSIHELGTSRMGSDPKTSALNQFQQSHDVKNLFVVDGSSHVNASCQNPTWTIMALAWRSCEYLADQLKKGDL